MPSRLEEKHVQLNSFQQVHAGDYTLDEATLRKDCSLDNGRHSSHSQLSLGNLQKLPREIICEILLSLDLHSLTVFRRVSRRAMGVVDAVPEYAQLVHHCPNILRAVLGLKAESYDCRMLYSTLATTACSCCGAVFSGYLYLITCRRVCHHCFTTSLDFLPVRDYHVNLVNTRLKPQDIARMPGFRTLVGSYTTCAKSQSTLLRLLDRKSVLQGTGPDTRAYTPFVSRVEKFDSKRFNVERYLAIISAPYFEAGRKRPCWGFDCITCDKTKDNRLVKEKYTREGFLNHLWKHGPPKRINGP